MPKFFKTYVAVTEADTLEEAQTNFENDGAEYGPSVDFYTDAPVSIEPPEHN